MNEQRPPAPLSAAGRQLLALNRALHDIPGPVFERGLERVAALQRAQSAARARRLVASVGVALALAAAVLLAVLAPQLLSRVSGDAAMPQAPFGHEPEQRVRPTEQRAVEPSPPQDRSLPGVQDVPAVAPEPARPTPRPSTAPAPPRAPRTQPPVEPQSLAQERAILGPAAEALAAGRHADARTQLQEHARRFPTGKLSIERDALATILACTLQEPGAKAAAHRFVERHPEALMIQNVRARCGLDKERQRP